MTRLRKTAVIIPLMILGPILAACAQQSSPESHGSPMANGMTNNGGSMQGGMTGSGMMGGGMMGGGMMGGATMENHPAGASEQKSDMNTMMLQMSQMMKTCNAMMQHHPMHSSNGDANDHAQTSE